MYHLLYVVHHGTSFYPCPYQCYSMLHRTDEVLTTPRIRNDQKRRGTELLRYSMELAQRRNSTIIIRANIDNLLTCFSCCCDDFVIASHTNIGYIRYIYIHIYPAPKANERVYIYEFQGVCIPL